VSFALDKYAAELVLCAEFVLDVNHVLVAEVAILAETTQAPDFLQWPL
jgi:hypothetical protein